jgi:preprotein translocase subunit SecD
MTFDLRRKSTWLAVALMSGITVLGGLAAVYALAPRGEPQLEKMRAVQAAEAEAALQRQGGARVVLKVDTDGLREAVLTGLRDDARRMLREQRIPFGGAVARDGSVEVRLREPGDRERALSALGAASSAGDVEIAAAGEGLIRLTPTEAGFAERVRTLRGQSIEVIEQRLREAGIAARGVQLDGTDRFGVLLPGVSDPERLNTIFNKRGRITFRLVDTSMSAERALQGSTPAGSEILHELNSRVPHLLLRQVVMEGNDINDAAPGFDTRTREPIVTFRFNANGARRFAQITQENVGRAFAVVLDDAVLSAPIIREPIVGGSGQISGSFTVEDANRIAMVMRSGTLPGHVMLVEQQVVGPQGKAQ